MKNNYVGSILQNKKHPFGDIVSISEDGQVSLKKKILVYDIETTGLEPLNDDITQLAYTIYSENFEIIKTYNKYFKLKEKTFQEIDPEVVEKTKITKELLDNGIDVKQGIGEFLRDAENCLVASYNGWTFDDKFITTKIYKYIQQPLWPTVFASDIDVFIIAIGALFGEIERMNLKSVAIGLGIDFDEEAAHDAHYDVHMTASVIPGIMRKLLEKKENFLDMCRYREQKNWFRHWRYDRYEEPWPATEKQVFFANRLVKQCAHSRGMKGPLEWLFSSIVSEQETIDFLKDNKHDFVNTLSRNKASELIGFILWFEQLGVKVR